MHEAKEIAKELLNKKLVACVNVIPSVTSFYTWEGQMEESGEVLMIIKTSRTLLPQLSAAVAELHSYDCPETIGFGVIGGNKEYMQVLNC